MEKLMNCLNYLKMAKSLKELLFGKHIVADRCFKFSTKYTVCMLMLLLFLTFQTDLNCRGNAVEKSNRNKYCLNAGTFLVTKALQATARVTVQYPGIAPYSKGEDEVEKQEHHKQINYIYGILIAIAGLPFFLWKVEAVRKIEVILKLPNTREMVKYYCACQGKSGDVSVFYILTKVMAIIVPIVQWFILCIFFGKRFQMYGIDIFRTYLHNTWPNPADVLFPKHVMCEMTHYTPTGHLQTISFICEVESNNLLRWSMCSLWFWMFSMFFIGITHLTYIIYLYLKSEKVKFGDFIILRFLSFNLNVYDFSHFMLLYFKRPKDDIVIDDEV